MLDGVGHISFIESIPTGPNADQFVTALCQLIDRTIRAADAAAAPRGIGVAIAGFLTPNEPTSPIIRISLGLSTFLSKERIAQRFDLPIELEIDSNAACMAEYRFGYNEIPERFMCLTACTGLGVGMTVKGELLRFSHGCMGDPGHVIVDHHGPLCSCGGRGCAEANISAPSLARRFEEAAKVSGLSLRDVISAAESGNTCATKILRDAGSALSESPSYR